MGRKSGDLGFFNMARGLGMLIILAGHSINLILSPHGNAPTLFSGAGRVLGGGLMAMFFLISGFSFYRRSPKKCLSIQAKLLLRPYCIVAAAVLLTKLGLAFVECRSFWTNGAEYILTYLLGLNAEGGGMFFGFPVESVSIFWFVLALFGGWIIYNGIVQLQNEKVQWMLVAGCTLTGYLLTLISKVWPFCLPMMLLAVGYLAVGAQIRKYRLLERKLPAWCLVLLLVPVLISAAFGDVNIVAGVWKLGPIDVLSTFCTGFLFLRLYAWFMQRGEHGHLVLLLESVGFYSIWVLCLHAYEKVIFPWYRLGALFPQSPWLAAAVCFCLRCAVIYCLYLLISYAGKVWRKRRKKRKVKIKIDL